MFFVFGSPRSGTTLLAQCLSAHPDVVVPHETDFIIPAAFVFDRVPDPAVGRDLIHRLIVGSAGFRSSLGEYLDEADVREAVHGAKYDCASVLDAIYGRIAAAADARIAGDKSPNDLNFLRILIKSGGIGPATRVVHIVRDVRDVMVSANERGWVQNLDLYLPRFWCSSNLYLKATMENEPSRYHLLRYEDLVWHPRDVLAAVCAFLDVDFRDDMLSPSSRHERYRRMGDAHANLYEPISTARIGMHRTALTPELRESYERQAREGLIEFGYAIG